MRLLRGAGALAIGKMIYDQARKPENQRRIKEAVSRFQASRSTPAGKRRA